MKNSVYFLLSACGRTRRRVTCIRTSYAARWTIAMTSYRTTIITSRTITFGTTSSITVSSATRPSTTVITWHFITLITRIRCTQCIWTTSTTRGFTRYTRFVYIRRCIRWWTASRTTWIRRDIKIIREEINLPDLYNHTTILYLSFVIRRFV